MDHETLFFVFVVVLLIFGVMNAVQLNTLQNAVKEGKVVTGSAPVVVQAGSGNTPAPSGPSMVGGC